MSKRIKTQSNSDDIERKVRTPAGAPTPRQEVAELIHEKLDAAKQASLKSGAQTVIEVEIEGVAPLLQDRFPDERHIELSEPSALATGVKPPIDYAKSLFVDETGLICEPALHLESTMAESAGEVKVKGQRMKTYRRGFKASVFCQPDYIPHIIQDLEKLTSPVPNGKGGKTLKTFPKLETGWRLKFYIQVHDEQIQPLVVKQVLENAGKRYGIGAWRPRNGRFTVVSWKELRGDEEDGGGDDGMLVPAV